VLSFYKSITSPCILLNAIVDIMDVPFIFNLRNLVSVDNDVGIPEISASVNNLLYLFDAANASILVVYFLSMRLYKKIYIYVDTLMILLYAISMM
jgi:hypothetical protein